MQLEHREKLLDKVFKDAREQLPTVEQWTDYDQIALHLLHEALGQLAVEKDQRPRGRDRPANCSVRRSWQKLARS